ncbi:MAG: glycosyltransferase family 39 protein, partial [Planctomycetota bacterium]
LSLLLGFFVFLWSKELYGERSGWLALFLYAFSPNILAHSRLATQDLGLAVTMFICSYYFYRFMEAPALKPLLLCGLLFGFALLTKITALFLLPIFLIYAFYSLITNSSLGIFEMFPGVARISSQRARLRQLVSLCFVILACGLLALLVINIGYGFQDTLLPLSDDDNHPTAYNRLPINIAATRWATDIILETPVPIPSPYVSLLKFQFTLRKSLGGVYFAGDYHFPGLWYLMLATFALKTPIPLLLLVLISIGFLVAQRQPRSAEWLCIIFVASLLIVFSFFSNVGAGLRYILPIYPFLFVLASRLMTLTWSRPRLANVGLLVLLTWYLLGTGLVYPNYLAYFNELIGGPKNGYKYLTDSNVDWGQDLKALKVYMENNQLHKIQLGYFGSGDASYYGIDYEYLPSVGLAPQKPGEYWWYEMDTEDKRRMTPRKGVIAVSATLLASPQWLRPLFYDSYQWLREHEPVDQVGHSILIFKID